VRERFAQDESRLRHRPVHRVDQQQHAVDHGQHPLHLAAEIRVPRRVDDIDMRAAVAHRAVFREDGDTALALEIVRVHHPLLHVLVRSEGARLLQQLVDERRFPVVDVGDDREVAQRAWHELDFENEARDSTLSA